MREGWPLRKRPKPPARRSDRNRNEQKVGGLGSFWGVVLAAILVGVVRGITIHFLPAAGEASMYVLMFLVLMLRPRGLLGERIEKFE